MNATTFVENNDVQNETGEPTPFDLKREALREKLLLDLVLGEEEDLVFKGTFDGCGDSGQYNEDAENEEVDELFADAINQFVHFDWYNNDGGGGDITWHVVEDRIVINGYYNEMVQTDVMSEAEF